MAKIKKRRLVWEPSKSSSVIGYKLYWAEEGELNYDSPYTMIGNVTEVLLPEQVPSFPIMNGSIQLGLTAINEIGNESDMIILPAPFQFSVPEAPTSPRLEPAEEYHICSIQREDRESAKDITGSDLAGDSNNQEVE